MMSRVSLILGVVTALVALLGGLQWLMGEYRAWTWRRKQTGKWLLMAGLCLIPSFANAAACPGSGTAFSCPSGTTIATLVDTVSAASDGAVVTFASGSYTWSSNVNFSNSKGITFICETVGACAVSITGGGAPLGIQGTCSGTNTKLYRISGFSFSGGNNVIWFYGDSTCHMTQIRIDHNTFDEQTDSNRILQFGDNSTTTFYYGVVDHNTVTASHTVMFGEFYGSSSETGVPSETRGTNSAMYFEDNVITITSMTNASAGCFDSTGSPSIVWRFNQTTNCLLTSHGALPTSGGSVLWEVYGNKFIVDGGATSAGYDDCDRCFHHQGSGEIYTFGNRFTQKSGVSHASTPLHVMHYRSASPAEAGYSGAGQCDGTTTGFFGDGNRTPTATYYGYPCHRQPGRDINANLRPMYSWDNLWTDDSSQTNLTCANHPSETPPPTTCTHHIVDNRDLFKAVSASAQSSSSAPFDGTTGMGFGTIARRPGSCSTASTDAGDAGSGGVGYASTDEGTWKTATPSQGNTTMPAYKLYNCGTADTWSTYYIPYTYPHPLVGGGGSAGGSFPFLLRSWPVVIEAASAIGALYHWRGVIAATLIFLLGCGITGASMIAQTTRQTIQWTKRTSYHSAQALAQHYLDWSRKG